jgi:hypothetical protein
MRFRMGLITGFAAGYYLGAMAGRERYEQINRTIARVKGSDVYEAATDKAKEAVEHLAHHEREMASSTHGNGHQVDGPAPPPWS